MASISALGKGPGKLKTTTQLPSVYSRSFEVAEIKGAAVWIVNTRSLSTRKDEESNSHWYTLATDEIQVEATGIEVD